MTSSRVRVIAAGRENLRLLGRPRPACAPAQCKASGRRARPASSPAARPVARPQPAAIGWQAPRMDKPPLIEIVAFTHEGRLRESNEDSITVAGWVSDVAMSAPRRSRHELSEPLLLAIADGMGG